MYNNGNYIQDVDTIAGLSPLLKDVGEEISKSLLKGNKDGTRYIVPPCEFTSYPGFLDMELNIARTLIKKPNLARALLYAVIGWVLVAMFVGEWIGLEGSDYFVAYFSVLVGCIANYLESVYTKNKRTSALADIRNLLMETYVNDNSPRMFRLKDLANPESEGIVVTLNPDDEIIRAENGEPMDIETPTGRVTPNPFNK